MFTLIVVALVAAVAYLGYKAYEKHIALGAEVDDVYDDAAKEENLLTDEVKAEAEKLV